MRRILMTGAALLALGGTASAQEVTLRVHHFLSAEAPIHAGVFEPWAQAVEDQSGGRIDVQIFPSMQLGGKPPQLFDQARDGIVDIAWTLLGYTPGRFPISEVFELPFMAGTAPQTTQALQAFQAKYLGDELDGVHVLALHTPAPYKFHNADVRIETLSDLKGIKVRAPSRAMTDGLNALGATAVGMPVPEVAQSLTTGVIDSAMLPWEVVGSLRLEDITRSHSEIGGENGGIATSIMAVVMNQRTYGALPDDLRAVIDANSGASLAAMAAEVMQEAEVNQRQMALDAGASITVIPEAELDEWRAASQPVIDGWVAAMDRAGHDGQAMLDDARAMLDAARGR